MMKQAEIKKALLKMENEVRGDSAFLFSSAVVGPNADRIHQWIGKGLFTRREAREWARIARGSGIWTKGNKLAVEWLGEDGWIAFICDVLTLRGMLERVEEKKA